MELAFQTQSVPYLRQILREVRTQEETAEVIVPDVLPDAERIVTCRAFVMLRSKECRSGCILVSGTVRAGCLYAPADGGAPRTLEADIPFTARFENASVQDSTQAVLLCRVRSADARIMNSRKVLLRVGIGCEVTGFERTEERFCTLQEIPSGLQVRTHTYPLTLPSETAEKSFTVSEELELGPTQPSVQQLAQYDALPVVQEQHVVGDKLVFKGKLLVSSLYLTPDGAAASAQFSVPFSQYLELSEDLQDQPCRLTVQLTGLELENISSQEGGKLLMSCAILAQCVAMKTHSVTLTEDAYATSGTLQCKFHHYDLECLLDRQKLPQSVRTSVDADVRKIIDCAVYPDFPTVQRTQDGAGVRTEAAVNLLYLDEKNVLQSLTERVEAETEFAAAPGTSHTAEVSLTADAYASAVSGGAEVRFDLTFDVCTSARQYFQGICEAVLEEEAKATGQRPSLILRPNTVRQPAWNIAKAYATTVSAILEANHLESEELEPGMMLLIPM